MVGGRERGYIYHKPVQEHSNNFVLGRKINEVCRELKPSIQRMLLELRDEDKELTADFISDWPNQYDNGLMMSSDTKRGYTAG